MAILFTVLLVGVMIASARADGRLDADRPSTPNSVEALEYHLDLNFNDDYTAIGGKVDIVVEFKQLESSEVKEAEDKKEHEYSIPVRVNAEYDITRIDLQTSDSIDGLGETVEPVVPMERSEDGKLVTIVMKSSAGSFGRITVHFEGPKAPDGTMLGGNGQNKPGQACDLFPCLDSNSLYVRAKIQLTVSRPDSPQSRVAIQAPIKTETSFEMNGTKFLRTEFEPQQNKFVNTYAFFIGTKCYGDCSAI